MIRSHDWLTQLHTTTRPPKRLTPVDVHQNKFEGKSDNQFLPMQADQEVTAKSGNNPGKNPPHQGQTSIPKVSNPGSNRCRDSLAIAKSILDIPLTLTLQEAVYISPRFRKDLVNVVKQEHKPLPPIQEKTTLVNEIASDNEPSDDQPQETFCRSVVCSCFSQSCDIIMWLWEFFSSI